MLSGKQKRFLRARGSLIRPSVYVGKEGFTPAVVSETLTQLNSQELVKVRVQPNSLEEPREVAALLSEETQSQLVQVAGRNFLLYRRHPEKPVIELP